MQILLTVPLKVQTAARKTIELLPVIMGNARPSEDPGLFVRFLKKDGVRIPISPNEVLSVQRYMISNRTEALSEDGVRAFTIAGNALVECLPDVCMNPTAD